MQILALTRDVELDASRQGAPFTVLLRKGTGSSALNAREYTALWQLCGARRKRGGFPPPPDEVERLGQRLQSERYGMPVAVPGGFEGLGLEHRVSLVDGLDLGSRLFEVLEANRRLGFLGPFDGLVLESCDGASDLNAIADRAMHSGFPVSPAHVNSALGALRAANLLVPGSDARPQRRPDISMKLDAILVKPPWGELAYLFGAEEADLLLRCRGGATIGQLAAQDGAQSEPDQAWIRDAVARACALALATVGGQPAAANGRAATAAGVGFAADPFAGAGAGADVVDEEYVAEPTRIESMAELGLDVNTNLEHAGAIDDVGLQPGEAIVFNSPHSTPAPSVSPGYSAAPAPMAYATPGPSARVSSPHMTPPMAAQRVSSPHLAPMSAQMPSPLSDLPPGITPVHRGTPPGGFSSQMPPGPPSRPTPIPNTPNPDAKLASLAALSLNKSGGPDPMTSSMPSRQAAPSKLPWVLLAAVLVGGGWYIKSQKSSATVPTTVDRGSGSDTSAPPPPHGSLLASGFVAAKAPITLSAKVSGRLEVLKVDAGAQIKKDQVVAQVSDTDARSALALASAKVREKKRLVQQKKRLVAAQAATPVDLETARGELDLANAEASVASQKLEDTRIRSPIDGTVLEVLIRPGEAVTPAGGVLRIANLSSLVAEVNVAETDQGQIYQGQICEVVSDANRDKKLKGVVREVGLQADKTRATVLVKVELEPITDGSLKPGMAVQVRFLAKEDLPPPADGSGSAAGSAAGSGSAAAAGSGSAK